MLRVRVLPRKGVALRSGLASAEVCTALTAGHVLAGGALPSPAWLGVTAVLVWGAGLLVLRGRVRPRVAVPALVAAQLLLHAWLTALAADPVMAAHPHPMPGDGQMSALDPTMLAVHVAGGLLTALAWELRARAVDVVVTWTDCGLPPLPAPPPAPTTLLTAPGTLSRLVVAVVPWRGPPVPLAA